MIELIQSALLGLVPDWLIAVWAFWPWIAAGIGTIIAVSLLYRVYRVGGWPGLSVAMGILGATIGYIFGRQSKPETKPTPIAKPVKKRRTLKDLFE